MTTSEAQAFAALVRKMKDRSGQSYGGLGRQLHMSASTLHRYCNGDAVPADYAPIERLARLCGADRGELVALHRAWIIADDARHRAKTPDTQPTAPIAPVGAPGREPDTAAEDSAGSGDAEETGDGAAAEDRGVRQPDHGAPEPVAADTEPGTQRVTEPGDEPGARLGPVAAAGARGSRRRRLTWALAAVAVAAVAVPAIVLGTRISPADAATNAPEQTADTQPRQGGTPTHPSPSPARSSSGAPSPSASATASGAPSTHAPAGPSKGATSPTGHGAQGPESGTPIAVFTRPYAYEDPCSQHFLVNAKPGDVPPPPAEQDAPGWVAALGGVAAGNQFVAVTVQGTGRETAVLNALHVRVVGSKPPLPWTDYAMGVGCGGGVGTASFAVDLDAGTPQVAPANGQRDFPYKVGENDPEVFYVSANAEAHDASWYLELDWSSGTRHGTLRIDDHGRPFRTSGAAGRPAYDYPLGGSSWEKAPTQDG